jgi:STE24 endopeptidase
VLVVTGLPVSAWLRARALDVGLATQSWPNWAIDVLKAAGIGAVTAAIGGLVAMALVRRFPRHWWAPAAVLVVAFGVVTIWLYPILIDPLFNRFDKLPDGRLRSEVLQLAKRAGVDVGQVYRVDASRRTSAANAYVIGLGHSKRVVLYDNLIDDFTPAEVRSVVAHELGHQKHNDLMRGLAWLAIVAPAGTFLTQTLAQRLAGRERLGTPAALPAIAFALVLVSLALGWASNVLSRRVEASADTFALEITHEPRAFIQFQRRISVQNVGDPDPPGWYHDLFGTHPKTVERIGAGVAFEGK